jgi:hypothetical protein
LRNEILSFDIHRKYGINITALDLGEISEVLNARVTNSDIEPSKLAVQSLEHGLHLFFLRNVCLECDGADTQGTDLSRDGLGG